MKVVIVGGTGLLGSDVVRVAEERGWDFEAPTRAELDITDADCVNAYFAGKSLDCIINCAAFSNVDAAEGDAFDNPAVRVNVLGPIRLSETAAASGARLLHVSSDYVFDGHIEKPYRESDVPNPLSYYGHQKFQSEKSVSERCTNSIVMRTAWLFGIGGRCFLKTILQAALHSKPLKIVADQTGSPTYSRDLARAVCDVVESGINVPAEHIVFAPPMGLAPDATLGWFEMTSLNANLLHLANSGEATWYELAKACLEEAGIEADITPITTEEWPTPAKRPKYSVLDTSKYQSLGFPPLRHWREAVKDFVQELRDQGFFK